MKTARTFPRITKRFYRPEQSRCPLCERPLRRKVTVSERTIITLGGVIRLIHVGYRCPAPDCSGHLRTYRSAAADALALPGFTFGLDIVLLVGELCLGEHHTLDETHRHLLERLTPLGVSISRREVLYLFDAYCTLLRAGTDVKEDRQWLQQVKANGGIILSMDGIQPDRGNETIYLVCDALDFSRVGSRERDRFGNSGLKAILGTISDAQESLLQALEQLWPNVPHQVCQFHALQDASRPAYEVDRALKAAMRRRLQSWLMTAREHSPG